MSVIINNSSDKKNSWNSRDNDHIDLDTFLHKPTDLRQAQCDNNFNIYFQIPYEVPWTK